MTDVLITLANQAGRKYITSEDIDDAIKYKHAGIDEIRLLVLYYISIGNCEDKGCCAFVAHEG